jgi:hypothetical protein
VAIINKDEKKSCNIKIKVEKQYCKQATLSRLLSPGGLLGKAGITWQGQTYENAGFTGKLQGQPQLQQLLPQTQTSSSCIFAVPVFAASAALLVSKAVALPVQTESAALRVPRPTVVPAVSPKAAAAAAVHSVEGTKFAKPIAGMTRRVDGSALRVGKPQVKPVIQPTSSSITTGNAAAVSAQVQKVTSTQMQAGKLQAKSVSKPAAGAATGTPVTASQLVISNKAEQGRASSALRVAAPRVLPARAAVLHQPLAAAGKAARTSKPKAAPAKAFSAAAYSRPSSASKPSKSGH